MISLRSCPDCHENKWVDVDDVLRRCAECFFLVHKDWIEEESHVPVALTLNDINWSE